jgi:hypothetical protein
MRFRAAITLVTFFALCFTIAVWGAPADVPLGSSTPPGATTQTITGKISTVGDLAFTLDIGRSDNPNKLQFLIDETTKMEGKLTVGARATVEYRSDGDKNIATRVVVTPASGLTSY